MEPGLKYLSLRRINRDAAILNFRGQITITQLFHERFLLCLFSSEKSILFSIFVIFLRGWVDVDHRLHKT